MQITLETHKTAQATHYRANHDLKPSVPLGIWKSKAHHQSWSKAAMPGKPDDIAKRHNVTRLNYIENLPLRRFLKLVK